MTKITEGSGSFLCYSTPHPEERSDEGSYEILQPFGLQDEPLEQKNTPRAQITITIIISLMFPSMTYAATEITKEDKNKDGRPDLWLYYENKRPVKIESDRNYDNKLDLWITYGQNGQKRTEIDLNFDGRPDMFSYYTYGQRTRLEIDTNYDGKLDQISTYANDRAVKIERDTNSDGRLEVIFDISDRQPAVIKKVLPK
jgi:hypothetical protein